MGYYTKGMDEVQQLPWQAESVCQMKSRGSENMMNTAEKGKTIDGFLADVYTFAVIEAKAGDDGR